jgi:hypothetical protein
MKKIMMLGLVGAWSLTRLVAQTNDLAVQYGTESSPWNGNNGAFMVGYDFTPGQNILVTSLGIMDWFGDGLNQAETVGIWDAAGTLLASATLPAGVSSGEATGVNQGFIYFTSITDLFLSAGATYRIGNQQFGGANEVVGYGGPIIAAPDIALGLGWGNSGTTFSEPTSFSNPTPYVGPVFKYEVQAAPEPSTFALLALGLIGGAAGLQWPKKSRI